LRDSKEKHDWVAALPGQDRRRRRQRLVGVLAGGLETGNATDPGHFPLGRLMRFGELKPRADAIGQAKPVLVKGPANEFRRASGVVDVYGAQLAALD
jgi:hypothetical protein